MATAKEILEEGLKCPICHRVFNAPKVLPCSHSFCEQCLVQLHQTQELDDSVRCAVCRQTTELIDDSVSNFPTNRALMSMATEFEERRSVMDGSAGSELCTVCDPDDQGTASTYCQNCSEYMCESCLQGHNKFKPNTLHDLVEVGDIQSGKIKKRRICEEHPAELELHVCIPCLMAICSRCLEVKHAEPADHYTIGILDYEESCAANAALLEDRAREKCDQVDKHSECVTDHTKKVKDLIGQRKQAIEAVYSDMISQLQEKKAKLVGECEDYENGLCENLDAALEHSRVLQTDILDTVSDMNKHVNGPSEDRSSQFVSDYAATCEKLEDLLGSVQLDFSFPEDVSNRAERLTFQPSENTNLEGISMGTVNIN